MFLFSMKFGREAKRPSMVQQELQKQQIEAMMSTAPAAIGEAKVEAEAEPAVAKFQLSNVGLKVVVSAVLFCNSCAPFFH